MSQSLIEMYQNESKKENLQIFRENFKFQGRLPLINSGLRDKLIDTLFKTLSLILKVGVFLYQRRQIIQLERTSLQRNEESFMLNEESFLKKKRDV